MALVFNGTNAKLQYVAGAAIVGALPVTVFAWIRPSSAAMTKAGCVGGLGDGSFQGGLELVLGGNDANDPFYASSRESGTAVYDAAALGAAANTWQPCMGVFTSNTSRTARVNAGSAATGTTSNAPNAANMWRINVGCRPSTVDTVWFDGEIAEFAIWSSALTQTDYDALAAGATPSTISPGTLIDYWDLTNQASTQTGINGRVLTASNTTQASTHPPVTAPDTTAPILTSPAGTTTGATTATVGATTNEGNGTLYAFVSTSSTPPAAATLKAGTGAAWAGSVAVSSTGAKTLNATGLTASTGYYAHLVHTDAAGNNSTIVSSAQFTTSAPAATAITLTGPSGGQVGVASAAFTVGANGAISGSHTVTPSDGGAGGSFSPANVTISAGTPTATFTYTPSTVGARTISAADADGYTAPSSLTYTATSTAGTLTSSALKNNTGTLLTGVAFEAFVNNPTTGALVVKKTGLTSSGAGVVTFADGALAAASSYRVVWRRTDTGAEGLETLTAT